MQEEKLKEPKLVSNKKLFECNICKKAFRFKSNFDNHSLVHDVNAERFICNICGRVYAQQAYLHCHRYMHFEKRPIRVKKTSELKVTLKLHQKIHKKTEKEKKPFACDQCCQRFKKNYNLKSHISKVHGASKTRRERNLFACGKCDKIYTREYLQKQLTHGCDDISDLPCPNCGKKSLSREHLLKYMLKVQEKDPKKRGKLKPGKLKPENFNPESVLEFDHCYYKKSTKFLTVHRKATATQSKSLAIDTTIQSKKNSTSQSVSVCSIEPKLNGSSSINNLINGSAQSTASRSISSGKMMPKSKSASTQPNYEATKSTASRSISSCKVIPKSKSRSLHNQTIKLEAYVEAYTIKL